jgi:hypothetical protein
MTNQGKVRSRYPHASAEQESTGEWSVWDISHDERKRLNDEHWPETFRRGLFGLGRTEAEAWADAVRKIEQREGRRLPVPNVGIEPPRGGRIE